MSNEIPLLQGQVTVVELYKIRDAAKEVVATFASIRAEGDAINRTLQSGQIREVSNAMQNLTQTSSQYENVTNQLTAAERRLQQVLRQLSIAESEQAQQIANVTAQTRVLTTAQRQRANEEQRLASLSDRERQRLGNTLNIYNAVQQKMNKLQAEYRNLATAKQLGMSLSDGEEKRMAALERRIQNYDKALKAVDGSMGIYRRNVGNYASGFNAMNNSVAQLAREAPAFTYSMQTGFMAISNNLPILFDSIRSAREENARLTAEGKKGVPIWKQLGSALFSWNTLLSIAITLLTVYGKDIGIWLKTVFQGVKAIDAMKKATEDLNAARVEGNKNAAEELVKTRLSEKIIKDETVARSLRLKEAENLQKLYPQIFGNMSLEQMLIDKTTKNYEKLRKAIIDTAIAEALKCKMSKATQEYLEKELKNLDEVGLAKIKIKKLETGPQFTNQDPTILPMDDSGLAVTTTAQDIKIAEKQLNDKRKIRKSDTDSYNAYMNKLLNITEKYQVAGASANKDYNPDKPKKPKADSLSAEQRNFLMRLEAARDQELAVNEKRYTEVTINEIKYLKGIQDITIDFNTKKINYLKGHNAKEVLEVAKAELEIQKAKKTYNEKAFEIESKELEENNKKKLNSSERYSKELDKNKNMTDTERVSAQINNYSDLLESQNTYYDDLIKLADKRSQPILEIERKRDAEIGNIINARDEKIKAKIEAYTKDIERETSIATSKSNLTYEEQKSLILSNKKLTNSEKEYQITLLDIDKQIEANKIQIHSLEIEKARYDLQVEMANLKGLKNPDAEKESASKDEEIQRLKNEIKRLNSEAKDIVSEKLQATRDALSKGFGDLGFNGFADAYSATMKRLKNDTASWKDYAVLAASAVLDSLTQLNEKQKEKTIANLDEQLKHSQETTEQEIGFINTRLEYLNNLDDLTKEQLSERNRLEDEARTYKEQQQQREKLIAIQKARAEQKAASQQALINGALAATMTLAQMGFIAGAIPAALALAFGIAQSIAISSRNPTPQYFVGTSNAKEGAAWIDERGAEIHTDKNDNIKSFGDNSGAKLVHMEAGDKVYTASQSKSMLRKMKDIPKLGDNLFKKAALNSLKVPSLNFVMNNNTPDNSQKIIDGLAQKIESIMKRNANPEIQYINGNIIQYHGSNSPVIRGKYDPKTGEETWYQ